MRKAWTDEAWEDYLRWQALDKRTFKRSRYTFGVMPVNFLKMILSPDPFPSAQA